MNSKSNGMRDVVALIPARGGSKGVPRKNIIPLGGYPLIAYPIAAALLSKHISRVIVSTDDEEIASVARAFGAEVPFMRPAELAQDNSTDLSFVEHAIGWLRANEGEVPEYLVELRTTTPLRKPEDIDAAVELFKAAPEATSLRSAHEIHESPYKLFGIENGYYAGLYPDDPRPEYYNLPRQTFPPVYQPNGYVDILKASFIEKNHNQHGNKMLPYITSDNGEIDTLNDLTFVQFRLERNTWEILEWLKSNFPNTTTASR
jgi:CMP-N-acetylneuraminic acid synthetase